MELNFFFLFIFVGRLLVEGPSICSRLVRELEKERGIERVKKSLKPKMVLFWQNYF